MDTKLKSRNRGTTNSEIVLQWGSSKRLRGVKKEGNPADNVSGALRKAIRADRRVVRAGKQARRSRKQCEGNLRPSSAANLHGLAVKAAKRAPEGANIQKQNSNEHVESLAVPGAEKNLPKKSTLCRIKEEIVIPENVGGGCLSAGTFPEDHQSLGMFLLPKFMIALSHKEKEEDFMAIKGSKLPQRPKKRAKHVQKALHCVSPGSWLCELSLDRYEVRVKKSLKKKLWGLKAMGSVDSDSNKS